MFSLVLWILIHNMVKQLEARLHPNTQKKIQIHHNYIIVIITKTSFFKTKLLIIYSDLNLLRHNNILDLEVLKFVFKFQRHYFLSVLMIIFNEPSETTAIKRVLL